MSGPETGRAPARRRTARLLSRLRAGALAFCLCGLPASSADAGNMNEIDIAVGYTSEALQAFHNDPGKLAAHILDFRDRTNAILEASGAPVRLNILVVEAIGEFRQTSFAADRKRFIRGRDGGEAVERLRDEAGADVRMLLVNYDGRGSRVHYGGIYDPGGSREEALGNAYVMMGTNAGVTTFAHEIGHVLGCQHARRRPCLGARERGLPFAYGFRSREGIGTIMASACATKALVPLYSSPALTYRYRDEGGLERSVALGSQTADCVRAMANNAPHLAGLNERIIEPMGGEAVAVPLVADLAGGRQSTDAATGR